MNRYGSKKEKGSNDFPWVILYHPQVVQHDIPRLSKTERERVKNTIEKKIAIEPALCGIPLRGVYEQYWKLRVGDWRVVYSLKKTTVYILVIAHRKEIYRIGKRRL